jgi:archaellum component FlaG (FlaF/FlaG flagellin family)
MRAGISRVVVEIIILVIAVALALLIFSPISGYIFGSLGRTATVGGAAQIQILNAQYGSDGTGYGTLTLYVKNLGPGTVTISSTNDFRVYVDGNNCPVSTGTTGPWTAGMTITVQCNLQATFDTTKQHNIVFYGPGNTQAQYLYYPAPS